MREGDHLGPSGAMAAVVEADETYFGKTKEFRPGVKRGDRPYIRKGQHGPAGKRAIVALVERGGSVRTFHVEHADKVTVTNIVNENIARESRLHTDESRLYTGSEARFAAHETVTHSAKEYARGDVHTNTR